MTVDFAPVLSAATRFHAPDLETAKAVILTGDAGSTDERWALETPWLQALIDRNLPRAGTFLDYGCGIGRVGRELGEPRTWINVDSSEHMLRLGKVHWGSRPAVWATPEQFRAVAAPNSLDGALAIYALQHIPNVREVLDHVQARLKPGAPLLVLNSNKRWLPVDGPEFWFDDGINMHDVIREHGFSYYQAFPRAAYRVVLDGHFCNIYVKD